jgi:hypothetical protein
MIYTTIYNKYLILDFRFFIIYIHLKISLLSRNIGSLFYENFNYIGAIVSKNIFINLLIRLIEINKEEKERYKYRKINIKSQFIDFFFIKIMLNYFYSLLFRFIYFILYFFFKYIFFILNKFTFKYLINLNLYSFFSFFLYRLKIFFIFLGYNYFLKIYNFIYYIKLEFFIYFINENNFFGGLILYIYNSLH